MKNTPYPSDSPVSDATGDDTLRQAAEDLLQAAALLQDLARQLGSGTASSLQVTVTDAAGDPLSATVSNSGPDLSLLS